MGDTDRRGLLLRSGVLGWVVPLLQVLVVVSPSWEA